MAGDVLHFVVTLLRTSTSVLLRHLLGSPVAQSGMGSIAAPRTGATLNIFPCRDVQFSSVRTHPPWFGILLVELPFQCATNSLLSVLNELCANCHGVQCSPLK